MKQIYYLWNLMAAVSVLLWLPGHYAYHYLFIPDLVLVPHPAAFCEDFFFVCLFLFILTPFSSLMISISFPVTQR